MTVLIPPLRGPLDPTRVPEHGLRALAKTVDRLILREGARIAFPGRNGSAASLGAKSMRCRPVVHALKVEPDSAAVLSMAFG